MDETKKSCEEVKRQEVVSPDGEQNKENERQSPLVSRWNSFVNSFVSWMHVYGELISEIVLMLCVAGVCYSMVCLVEIISLFG